MTNRHVRNRVHPLLVLGSAAIALTASLSACSEGTSASGGSGDAACEKTVDKEDVKLVLGVGDFSSAYWQEVIAGAQAVADSLDVPLKTYESNYDGQTMLDTLSSALAGGGEGTGVIVDPASNAFTKPIVQSAQQAGAHIVTLWNRPLEIHPWDFGGGCWVAHTSFSGEESGVQNTEQLVNAIDDKGNIVALEGVPDDPPNKQRLFGLHEALHANADVQLLETQSGHWSAANAQKVVNAWLAKYPGQIDGIFSANDDMAVGAVEALRAKGLAGKIPVTGSDGSADMLNLIKQGDALSTMQIDAYGQGAYAAAIAYASLVGDIQAAELTQEQRDFYLNARLVTKENVDEAMQVSEDFDPADYTYDELRADLWARVAAPIDDETWIPAVPD